MVNDVLKTISTKATPQNQKTKPNQVENSAGGFVFEVSDEQRLRRFLTLGVDGGTYYASAKDLAIQNVKVLEKLAKENPEMLLETILDVSLRGAAPKQNPTIFALAYAASVPESSKLALENLSKIARTGTHLFMFADYVQQFRGWGRGLRRSVSEWYTDKDPDVVAYQAAKYRQRNGWTHRDLLRLSHPSADSAKMKAVFDWITKQNISDETPQIITAFMDAQTTSSVTNWEKLVKENRLSWEMLPDVALQEANVWNALLDVGMPQTALIRQLPKLTRLGVTDKRAKEIAAQLTDEKILKAARVHPVNVLVALKTYSSGKSVRGESTWTPNRIIIDALDEAFYKSFGTVEPAGKRTLLALDVSGSMTSPISNMPIDCRQASAALALVQMATEPESTCVGFTSSDGSWFSRNTELSELPISPRQRLDDAVKAISNIPFGGTDCSLPMSWATEKKLEFDTFVIYTDNETWAGKQHPHQALTEYRNKMNIPAKLIVVGMTATNFSIADPNDPGMLDIAGFDSAVPNLITDFSRGF